MTYVMIAMIKLIKKSLITLKVMIKLILVKRGDYYE